MLGRSMVEKFHLDLEATLSEAAGKRVSFSENLVSPGLNITIHQLAKRIWNIMEPEQILEEPVQFEQHIEK